MRACSFLTVCGILSGLLACQPDLGDPASLVKSVRILAVRSEPAEVLPAAQLTLSLLLATQTGASTASDVEWAFCATPKPPVDNNIVSDACVGDGVRILSERTSQISAKIPADACALFGPQLPPAPTGQPPARPRDPDGTGGYYQPVRVHPLAWSNQGDDDKTDSVIGFGLTRILCGLAGASADLAAAYRDQYQINRNPQVASIRITDADKELPINALPRRRTLSIQVTWNVDAAERFPVLDPESQMLVTQTESLQLAWFANRGSFALAHTVAETGASENLNTWTTPEEPGPVSVWIVLRDSRGGVDFASLSANVN